MWSRCRNVVVEGHIIELGEPLGTGKRWWEGKGEEGGQYTSNLGPEWTEIAPHAEEGFQVSKRGSGTGEGAYQAKGVTKGIVTGFVPCASDNANLYISCNCVCVNRELCLGYK